MRLTALIKLASTPHVVPVAILSGVILLPSVFNEATAEISSETGPAVDPDSRAIRVEEFRALEASLADLSLQLTAQQELIANQHEEIDGQRILLQSIQAQVGLLATDQTVEHQSDDVTQGRQSITLDELVTRQPESTRYSDVFFGSIPIPGTEAAVKIGGFAKMSMVGTFDPLGTDDRFITRSEERHVG